MRAAPGPGHRSSPGHGASLWARTHPWGTDPFPGTPCLWAETVPLGTNHPLDVDRDLGVGPLVGHRPLSWAPFVLGHGAARGHEAFPWAQTTLWAETHP